MRRLNSLVNFHFFKMPVVPSAPRQQSDRGYPDASCFKNGSALWWKFGSLTTSGSIKGRLVTGDAMFCHRELCEQIVDSGGDYLFVVKDNQPELKAAIEADFQPGFPPTPPKSGDKRRCLKPARFPRGMAAPSGGICKPARVWPGISIGPV